MTWEHDWIDSANASISRNEDLPKVIVMNGHFVTIDPEYPRGRSIERQAVRAAVLAAEPVFVVLYNIILF